ncbi:MAG: ABC transporter substrate-binding protein, partial [Planctomycetes bacterium]|nr:ABC transporter substrate-binding protein [Planctomycetota bacterium]
KAGLPVPRQWDDLARPEYFSWVGSGDPRRSGSVHMCYEIILQAEGLEKGWKTITLLSANVRRFGDSGGTVPNEIAAGDIAAGMVIDQYGQRVINTIGEEYLKFILPADMTLVGPDAIGIIRNDSNPVLSDLFVQFALSEEGQRILFQHPGTNGQKKDLCRMPVVEALYSDPQAPKNNPFTFKGGFAYDVKLGSKRWRFVNDLIGSCLIDSHEELCGAWKAVIEKGAPEDLVNELCALPFRPDEVEGLIKAWKETVTREEAISRIGNEMRERFAAISAKAKND